MLRAIHHMPVPIKVPLNLIICLNLRFVPRLMLKWDHPGFDCCFRSKPFLPFSRTVNTSQRHKTACRVNDERHINGAFYLWASNYSSETAELWETAVFLKDTSRACEGGRLGSVRHRLGFWGGRDCFRNKQHAQRGGKEGRQ